MVRTLIKETVDAVRLAEQEAEKVINTAQDNAQDKKNQVKSEGEAYRAEALNVARESAELKMQSVVDECKKYEEEYNKGVDKKIAELRKQADSGMDEAVDAVIRALV